MKYTLSLVLGYSNIMVTVWDTAFGVELDQDEIILYENEITDFLILENIIINDNIGFFVVVGKDTNNNLNYCDMCDWEKFKIYK